MKTFLSILLLVLSALAVTTAQEPTAQQAHAQQKAVGASSGVLVYSLNAEASQDYIKLEHGKQELIKQFQSLEAQQFALMVGAGIPKSELRRQADVKNNIVTFPLPPAPVKPQ